MSNTKAGTEMLDEALAHVNEAAKERREDVKRLVDEKYTDLRSAVGGAANASADWAREQGREVGDKARLAARTVNRSVRTHPWYYVGGAAASGLLVGLLVGRRTARPAPARER